MNLFLGKSGMNETMLPLKPAGFPPKTLSAYALCH